MKDYKSIQMLASISMIGGPVSLLVGGVPLSAAAVICGIIALVMLRKGKESPPSDEEGPFSNGPAIAQNLIRQAIIGTSVSAVALILNGAALASIMPAMLEAIQTGDYSSLWNATDPSASSSSAAGSAFGGGPSAADQGGSASSGSIWG